MKIGFFALLALLFIGLKLTGAITWSWVWVLAPIWGGFVFFLLLYVTLIAIAVAASR